MCALVGVVCCQVQVFCLGPISRPEESYGSVVCLKVIEKPR
jgi:hypothetical protein